MPVFDFISVSFLSNLQRREATLLNKGAPREHRALAPLAYTENTTTPLVGLFQGLKRLMRLSAKALYLFPLLLLVKAFLWAVQKDSGDLITVVFVILVVWFFFLLALFMLLFPFVGPPSKRKSVISFSLPEGKDLHETAKTLKLPPTSANPSSLWGALPEGDKPIKQAICVRGTIKGWHPEANPYVLYDAWSQTPDGIVRFFRSFPFVLVGENQPPIVVTFEAAPVILASYRKQDLPFSLDDPLQERLKHLEVWLSMREPNGLSRIWQEPSCVLSLEQEVEIYTSRFSIIPRISEFSIEGKPLRAQEITDPKTGPYRGTTIDDMGICLCSTPNAPLIIKTIRT
jgi:hypothetical protein